jgi:hypothetical protein
MLEMSDLKREIVAVMKSDLRTACPPGKASVSEVIEEVLRSRASFGKLAPEHDPFSLRIKREGLKSSG